MAWDDTLVLIVRNLTGDISDTPTYTDDRLADLILVATKLLSFEVSFPTKYQADLDNTVLTPDPTMSNPQDDSFISLCCLKSALILLGGETNKSTGQSIQVKDGSSLVDLRTISQTKLALLQELQKQYNEAKLLYQMTGSTGSVGQMIITPFRLTSVPNILYPYPGILGHF